MIAPRGSALPRDETVAAVPSVSLLARGRVRWPLPAVGVWLVAWATFLGAVRSGLDARLAFAVACAVGVLLAPIASGRWKRALVAGGFPLSFVVTLLWHGGAAWAWLVPAFVLLGVYPLRAWRDAPFFPTPRGALDGLADAVPLPAGATVLDVGSGLGDGIVALRRQYAQARIEGVEWSRALRFVSARRCRDARIHRGDLWAHDWSPYALVYCFQRPESMARVAEKAGREMARGAWLASLEFEVPGVAAERVLQGEGRKPVWLYRLPLGRSRR